MDEHEVTVSHPERDRLFLDVLRNGASQTEVAAPWADMDAAARGLPRVLPTRAG